MKDHNIDRLVDALQRLTIEVQLFREAFVANNMSICESCSNNPCNKKAMLGDRRILECTMYDHKTENSSEIPNNCETCRHWQTRKDIYDLEDAYCELFYDNAPCHYEPKTEPTGYNLSPLEDETQTEDEILREQCRAFMGIVEQTEREGE